MRNLAAAQKEMRRRMMAPIPKRKVRRRYNCVYHTFGRFQKHMITFAKKMQEGADYPGDDYYRGNIWRDYYTDGDTPERAVLEDMRCRVKASTPSSGATVK